MAIVLTDDEAVALALGAGVPWPFALPAVADTVEDLQEASFRGLRSLRVRDLVRITEAGSQASAELMEGLEPVLAGRLTGAVTISDRDGVAKPGNFVFAYYSPLEGDQGLLESLASDGVHSFTPCNRETWIDIAKAMVDLAHTGALAEVSATATDADGVVVSAPNPVGGARGVVVGRGSARVLSVDASGEPSPGDEGELGALLASVLAADSA